jgi:cytochrome c oxidase cbb3-type subunit 1
MATIAAQANIKSIEQTSPPADTAPVEGQDEHGIPRFFFAACLALLLSATQGVVQRIPAISDWLRDADYGGHMVTNLAHTHITIVGAGTISLTGLIYFVLPRVTRRRLFSSALTNVSFWATLIGVFGFYIAMLAIGAYEGMMVHAGWSYEAARDWMGAWHKAPMAMTAAVMGLGYWTFVTNVYVTVSRAARQRKLNPAQGPTDGEMLLAKFFVVGATGLLFGTVQGVYQVMPWSLDWLHKTGDAGHLIDPMAHAHMNLVGGVSVALMGLVYYFMPRITGKPIFSMKLGVFSFWCIVIGVFGFYFSAIGLGLVEGEWVLRGMTDVEAKEAMGPLHPILLASAATVMGLGFWSFITNVLLTVRRGVAPSAPPDRKLLPFLGFSAVAILIGTIQGVIQILPPVEDWLEEALPAGYLVTPLAHAQLNMVGFVIVSLCTMMVFLLPRLLGHEVKDPVGGRRALTVICLGIAASYVVYFTIGLLESRLIHEGYTAAEARAGVATEFGRHALIMGAQALLGLGYFLIFRHVASVIGRELISKYFADFRGRMSGAIRQSIRVHPRARMSDRAAAQRRGIGSALLELIFLGLGWFFSGRPFMGILMFSLGTGYVSIAFVVLAIAENTAPAPYLLAIYAVLLLLSAGAVYRTYMRDWEVVPEVAVAPEGTLQA